MDGDADGVFGIAIIFASFGERGEAGGGVIDGDLEETEAFHDHAAFEAAPDFAEDGIAAVAIGGEPELGSFAKLGPFAGVGEFFEIEDPFVGAVEGIADDRGHPGEGAEGHVGAFGEGEA